MSNMGVQKDKIHLTLPWSLSDLTFNHEHGRHTHHCDRRYEGASKNATHLDGTNWIISAKKKIS